jgi:hypothetical protein
MSADGRPIASITPPVSIYVTALLEFVAEHILGNVGRVIERDNSDEASLTDLRKALEEDESCSSWWDRMATRTEVETRERELSDGKRGSARPWMVPDDSELDEAAGRKKFARQSLNMGGGAAGPAVRGLLQQQAAERSYSASAQGHGERDAGAQSPGSTSMTHTTSASATASSLAGASASTGETSRAGEFGTLTRRPSMDKGWGILTGRRRGSFRGSQDLSAQQPIIKQLSPNDARQAGDEEPADDDFEALMMSGQTMKVSLTPNRLRTIEVAKEEEDGKRSTRRRPGTLTMPLRDGGELGVPSSSGSRGAISPAPTMVSRISQQSSTPSVIEEKGPYAVPSPPASGGVARATRSGSTSTSSLRGASNGGLRYPSGGKASSQPPSAYRGPADMTRSLDSGSRGSGSVGEDVDDEELDRPASSSTSRLQPRDESQTSSIKGIKEVVSLLQTTPPSPVSPPQFDSISSGRESRQSDISQQGGTEGRKSALGGRLRSVFAKRSSVSGTFAAPQPRRVGSSASARSGPFGFTHTNGSEDNVASSTGHSSSSQQTAAAAALARANRNGAPQTPPSALLSDGEATLLEDPEIEALAPVIPIEKDLTPQAKEAPLPPLPDLPQQDVAEAPASGLVGLYEEPLRRTPTPPSPAPDPNNPRTEPPSRKVPWSYSRNSTSSAAAIGASIRRPGSSAAVERNAAAAAAMAGSMDGHSSSGQHHAPSAWNAQHISEDASGVNTPTPSHGAMGSITGGALSGDSARSSFGAPRMSASGGRSELTRALSDLDLRMRECTSVEECRLLVAQALAVSAAASVHPSSGGFRARPGASTPGAFVGDIPDEGSSSASVPLHTIGSRPATGKDSLAGAAAAQTSPAPISEARPQPLLAMAADHDVFSDETSTTYKQSGVLAAWLLDGEAGPVAEAQPVRVQPADEAVGAMSSMPSDSTLGEDREEDYETAYERDAGLSPVKPRYLPRTSLGSSTSDQSLANLSLPAAPSDSEATFSQSRASDRSLNRRISNVPSLQSQQSFRDAQEELEAEMAA